MPQDDLITIAILAVLWLDSWSIERIYTHHRQRHLLVTHDH